MAAIGIAQFLEQLEQRARRDIAQHLGLLRWGLTALGAVFGLEVGSSMFDVFYWPNLPMVAAIVAGAGLGCAAGFWLARRSSASLPGLRAEVRVNLLDRGLLQLVLEHDPYDRLPSLRPVLPGLLSKRYAQTDSGPVTERLERFIQNYLACCAEAGLSQGSAPVAPASPPTPRDRFLYFLGMALFIGAIPGVSELEHRFQLSLDWLRVPLLIGAISLLGRRASQGVLIDPLTLPSLLPSALRLELAEILRGERGGVSPGAAAGLEATALLEQLETAASKMAHNHKGRESQ